MLLTEYNEKKTMKAFRKEAFEEGYQKGEAKGYQQGEAKGYQQGEAERQTLAQELQEARRQIADLQETRRQGAGLQELQRQIAELQKQNDELQLFTDTLRQKGLTLEELSQAVQQWHTEKEG